MREQLLREFLTSAIKLIEERGDYQSPTPDLERPSCRTLRGCVGEEWLEAAKSVAAAAETVEE